MRAITIGQGRRAVLVLLLAAGLAHGDPNAAKRARARQRRSAARDGIAALPDWASTTDLARLHEEAVGRIR